MTTFMQAWSEWSLGLARFGANWLLQSFVLATLGLLIAAALRRWGAATQSAIYRTTLAAVLVVPTVSVVLAGLGFDGWSIPLSVVGIEVGDDSRINFNAGANSASEIAGDGAVSRARVASVAVEAHRRTRAENGESDASFNDKLAAQRAFAAKPQFGPSVDRKSTGFVAGLLATTWLIISCVLLARLARSWRKGRALCRDSVAVDEATVLMCQNLAESYGIAATAVRRSPFVTSPCVVGILRPAILMAESDDGLDVGDVLAHELAHVARRDGLWNLLRHTATSMLFMQPLVWRLSGCIEAAAEETCDDFAIRAGADRVRYAEQLCGLAALSLPMAVAVGMKTPRTTLTRRVQRILDSKRGLSTGVGARRYAGIVAAGIALTAVAGLAGADRAPALARVDDASAVIQPRSDRIEAAKASSRGTTVDSETGTVLAAGTSDQQPAAGREASATQAENKLAPRRGRLFARGFLTEEGQLKGMCIASIDPDSGAWKRLIDNSDSFAVSPDGQTIVYSHEGALWNGDAKENANPGKVFGDRGSPVFSPDSRTMLVTTWKRKPNKEEEWEGHVWKMGIDGTNATPLVELDGAAVRDWTSDGRWLLVEPGDNIELVRPDGKERQRLPTKGYNAHFSPDGKQVLYVRPWEGMIRTIGVDGTNDKLVFQAPNLTHIVMARLSPDGKQVGAVLHDLQLGNDGKTPVLYADFNVTHPRVALIDTTTEEMRLLALPKQEGWEFHPTGEIDWR